MILIDMNQISVASLMMHLHMNRGELEEDMVRHMILNSVRMYRTMFNEDYGEMVLAYDSKSYWRREFFPLYKASRRQGREESTNDWDVLFNLIWEIKEEISENFPYKVIAVDNAEADDIIATIIKLQKEDKYLIISGDKDFKQLQRYSNVSQYSPIQKVMIVEDNPSRYLHEQIIKGDRSDGIPNILSPDDVFMTKTKQSPITKKKLEEWSQIDDIPLGSETKKYYNRNKKLIDLTLIPNSLEETIINSYTNYEVPSRSKLLPYFINFKLKSLIENINDF